MANDDESDDDMLPGAHPRIVLAAVATRVRRIAHAQATDAARIEAKIDRLIEHAAGERLQRATEDAARKLAAERDQAEESKELGTSRRRTASIIGAIASVIAAAIAALASR